MPRENTRIFRVKGFEEARLDSKDLDNLPIIITGSHDSLPPYTKQRYPGMTRRGLSLWKRQVNRLQRYVEAAKDIGRRVHFASEVIKYSDFRYFLRKNRAVEIVGGFSEWCVPLAIEEIVRRRKIALVNPAYTISGASELPELHRGKIIINYLLTENPDFNCYICGMDLIFSKR